MKDLFIRRIYTKGDISVTVELDFIKRTVSLTDREGDPKLWRFTNRTPDYLLSWRRIMNAMEYAVAEAQKEMQAVDEKEYDDLIQIYRGMDKALSEAGLK